MRAQHDILGEDYNQLHVLPGRNIEGNFASTKNVDVPRNHLSLQYLLDAYDISASTFKRLRLRGGEALPPNRCHIIKVCRLSPTKSTQLRLYSALLFCEQSNEEEASKESANDHFT
jgi:hypothetical protein